MSVSFANISVTEAPITISWPPHYYEELILAYATPLQLQRPQ